METQSNNRYGHDVLGVKEVKDKANEKRCFFGVKELRLLIQRLFPLL